MSSQDPPLADALNSLHRVTQRKVKPDNEEEQFKQALNVRQGGIRKPKPETKVKSRQQQSAKVQKSVAADSKMETQKPEFSDPENEQGPLGQYPAYGATRAKKLHRNSQNVEPRYVRINTVQ